MILLSISMASRTQFLTVPFTSARTPDNDMAEALISGDEAAVYADRIYESKSGAPA